VEKEKAVYLESTTKVHGRNVRFYYSNYLFSNGCKSTIRFVDLHVSHTYSMIDLSISMSHSPYK
jgi:hypothetical protein